MSNWGLRSKIVFMLVIIGVIASTAVSVNVYRTGVQDAIEESRADAMHLLSRSVEMFMVSTRKFHDDFIATRADTAARARIMDDWNRTIFAVDEAVIHNHGDDVPRIRLIGDTSVFGYRPLGEGNTRIEIPFEREAGALLAQGEEQVERIDDSYLRVAIPLPSDAHIGCAECHFSEIEGPQADMSRSIVLGSLNAYMPLAERISSARANAIKTIATMFIGLAVMITIIFVLMERVVITPVKESIDYLKETATNVTSAATEILDSSQKLAESTNQQASGIEEVASTIEEFTAMTRNNSENARMANDMSRSTQNSALRVSDAMKKMNDTINQIKSSSDQTAKIVKTIDEIAFQTNLLALNAAVEAARAGEAGMGFAVVAEEVRNLAQRSAEAAKNTAALIEESQTKADNGVKASDEVNDILAEITDSVEKVTQLIGEVSAASHEQAEGITQLNSAVMQMDQVTQSNAANAEESASSSEELNSQAEELKTVVKMLLKVIGERNDNSYEFHTASAHQEYDLGQIETAEHDAVSVSSNAFQHLLVEADKKPEDIIPLDNDF